VTWTTLETAPEILQSLPGNLELVRVIDNQTLAPAQRRFMRLVVLPE
jgi:hypothetical protein